MQIYRSHQPTIYNRYTYYGNKPKRRYMIPKNKREVNYKNLNVKASSFLSKIDRKLNYTATSHFEIWATDWESTRPYICFNIKSDLNSISSETRLSLYDMVSNKFTVYGNCDAGICFIDGTE